MHQSNLCFTSYQKYFDAYELGLALDSVEHFFWHDFCDNYLELIKNQLFKPENYDANIVAATRWTLYTVGLRILQLYAPYLPHITEKLYQRIYLHHEKTISLHQTQLLALKEIDAKNIHADMKVLLHIISEVRKLKTAAQLALKTPLETLAMYKFDSQKDMLVAHEKIIKGISKAANITYHKESATSSLQGTEPFIIMHINL